MIYRFSRIIECSQLKRRSERTAFHCLLAAEGSPRIFRVDTDLVGVPSPDFCFADSSGQRVGVEVVSEPNVPEREYWQARSPTREPALNFGWVVRVYWFEKWGMPSPNLKHIRKRVLAVLRSVERSNNSHQQMVAEANHLLQTEERHSPTLRVTAVSCDMSAEEGALELRREGGLTGDPGTSWDLLASVREKIIAKHQKGQLDLLDVERRRLIITLDIGTKSESALYMLEQRQMPDQDEERFLRPLAGLELFSFDDVWVTGSQYEVMYPPRFLMVRLTGESHMPTVWKAAVSTDQRCGTNCGIQRIVYQSTRVDKDQA